MCDSPRSLVSLPLALLAAGCASSSGAIGQAPIELVELYDLARPDGVIEIELDRDGRLLEIEAEIPVDALPATVREAALQRAPGGRVVGAERELQRQGELWEVKVQAADGRAWEFVLDDDGAVLETEQELRREEAPPEVLAAADRALSGGTFRSVERIESDALGEQYHVKKDRDGTTYKIVLESDGSVLRVVREARAEIEIPLAR